MRRLAASTGAGPHGLARKARRASGALATRARRTLACLARTGDALSSVLGAAAATAAWLAAAGAALAESPAPSQAVTGDPRAGQAAGFVGNPALAIGIVVLIVVSSVAITLAWIRATGGRRGAGDRRP